MVSCLLLDNREILSFAEPLSFASVTGQLESCLLLVSRALKHSASSVTNQLCGTCSVNLSNVCMSPCVNVSNCMSLEF